MKKGLRARGYTLVEVTIVLAVTSAMFVLIAATMSTQRHRTEFSQAMRDVELQLQDIINDTSTGFYNTQPNLSCSAAGGAPAFGNSGGGLGRNSDCIFIGKVVQFAPGGDRQRFNIYTVAGLRTKSGTDDPVATLTDARPRTIAHTASVTNFPEAVDEKNLLYGLNIASMSYRAGGSAENIGGIGFISSLGAFSGDTFASGGQTVRLIPIRGTNLSSSKDQMVQAINSLSNSSPVNPIGGVTLCFDSGGTPQSGRIVIGGDYRNLSTNMSVTGERC